MTRHSDHGRGAAQGPTQRQLRAGELIRHSLVEILREEDFSDAALEGRQRPDRRGRGGRGVADDVREVDDLLGEPAAVLRRDVE